jgi:NNP family nitrate/nitrite transporter-like MFS transporter
MMTSVDRELPPGGSPRTWAPLPLITLAVAAVGLALNLRASLLLGPYLKERFELGPAAFIAILAIPLVVAALVRLPAGVLTDRHGARVMFPAVSLCTATATFGLAFADSLPGVVVAGCAAGVGGAGFVVGASLVSRTFSYKRRGVALGVFGFGTAGAVLVAAVARWQDPHGQRAAEVLGALLVGYAALSWLLIRDKVTVHRAGSTIRICSEMVRLASTTSLTLLYGLALGGTVAIAVYLPSYLARVYHLGWSFAVMATGAVLVSAATGRLFGGWWTDRRGSVRLLMICYAASAGLCLTLALQPPLWPIAVATIGAIAVLDGVAAGALLALICKAARSDSVGAVTGVAGAAAAVGGLLIPLVMAGLDHLSHSYRASWTLLAMVLLGAAVYVRANGLRIGMGLAVRADPEPSPAALSVVLLGEFDTDLGAAAIVARLAELATRDELVVAYQVDDSGRGRLTPRALLAGMRDRIPRHTVVAITIDPGTRPIRLDAAIIAELLEVGTIVVAVTSSADPRDVTAELAQCLRADRVLGLSHALADGPRQAAIWTRGSTAASAE